MNDVLFIDRDGTLVREPSDFQIDSADKIRLYPGVITALHDLARAGFQLIMVSNQEGLGTPGFPWSDFQPCHDLILDLFASQGIHFNEVFICPHRKSDPCQCRKPATGLLDRFIEDNPLNPDSCWVIGDEKCDSQLAENLGIAYLPISADHSWSDVATAILKPNRTASIERKTRKMEINLILTLDSADDAIINTPVAFFNQMLEQVAKHAGFYLYLKAGSDTDVDDHLLIEDCALALGEAMKTALGDKRGIQRYGFTLPMDESLASVTLDLCDRPFCAFNGQFTRETISGMATEMVPHFFQSLSYSLGATIHVTMQGQNNHHMAEACFKALGRSLRQAMNKTGYDLPSTKGVL